MQWRSRIITNWSSIWAIFRIIEVNVINRFNAEFEYINVDKDDIHIVFENNMLRIKHKKGHEDKNFGKIHDLDGTVYEANEIRIHTPGFNYINN